MYGIFTYMNRLNSVAKTFIHGAYGHVKLSAFLQRFQILDQIREHLAEMKVFLLTKSDSTKKCVV